MVRAAGVLRLGGYRMRVVLRGQKATDKAAALNRVSVSDDGWEITLIDDRTGTLWLLDYPDSEYHGGGSARLTQLDDHDEENAR